MRSCVAGAKRRLSLLPSPRLPPLNIHINAPRQFPLPPNSFPARRDLPKRFSEESQAQRLIFHVHGRIAPCRRIDPADRHGLRPNRPGSVAGYLSHAPPTPLITRFRAHTVQSEGLPIGRYQVAYDPGLSGFAELYRPWRGEYLTSKGRCLTHHCLFPILFAFSFLSYR